MTHITQPHIGRKIERIRTLKGIKQDDFGDKLGMSQGAISKMEKSENISDDKLEEVANALGVTADAIKNFDEDAIVSLMNNIHNNHFDNASAAFIYNQNHSNEKVIELYEKLLKEKDEIIAAYKKRFNGES